MYYRFSINESSITLTSYSVPKARQADGSGGGETGADEAEAYEGVNMMRTRWIMMMTWIRMLFQ